VKCIEVESRSRAFFPLLNRPRENEPPAAAPVYEQVVSNDTSGSEVQKCCPVLKKGIEIEVYQNWRGAADISVRRVSLRHPQTLSRIQNWQDLHPIEQERTLRLLVKKRNLVRLQKLDAENGESPAGEERSSALQNGP